MGRAIEGVSPRKSCRLFFIKYKILAVTNMYIWHQAIACDKRNYLLRSDAGICLKNLIKLKSTLRTSLEAKIYNKLSDGWRCKTRNTFKIIVKNFLLNNPYYFKLTLRIIMYYK